jgi:hypothetical protein
MVVKETGGALEDRPRPAAIKIDLVEVPRTYIRFLSSPVMFIEDDVAVIVADSCDREPK